MPVFVVIVLCVAAISTIRPTLAVGSNPTGLVIPLYTDPSTGTWATVLNAKNAHPTVPMIVVINPNNGPGTYPEPGYLEGIKAFQAAGITVLGYIPTAYATAYLGITQMNIYAYWNWFRLDGIMFDEMSDSVANLAYYSILNAYVKQIGMTYTMGNPGMSVPSGLIGTLDNLVVYENPGYPALSVLSQYLASKTNFAVIAYGVPLNAAFLASASPYVSWLWVTDDNVPNPYDSLPSYFASEVAALDVSVGLMTTQTATATITQTATVTATTTTTVSVTTTQAPPSGPQPFTIKTVNQLGAPISGFWVVLYDQFNVTIRTGFTPSTWTLNPGSYMVQVDSYGACNANHWTDGGPSASARSKLHAFAIGTAAIALTAVYNC